MRESPGTLWRVRIFKNGSYFRDIGKFVIWGIGAKGPRYKQIVKILQIAVGNEISKNIQTYNNKIVKSDQLCTEVCDFSRKIN